MFKFISIKTHTVKGKSDGIITLPHIIIPRSTPVLQISEKTISTVIKINITEIKNNFDFTLHIKITTIIYMLF